MSVANLALQRSKYKHLSDDEWRWFLQQVDGRERTADKLPAFAAIEDWWYPVRLSCEQCSSEATARYKAQICQQSGLSADRSLLDLTGGYGVDTLFLSEAFDRTDYVEQNDELCRIAEHNFPLFDKRRSISVHNASAEDFLKTAGKYDLLFLDPARRDHHGGKVFRLADCTPNVVELLPELCAHLTENGRIMLKLSPMLDITQATKELSLLLWDVYVIAVKNEVKEVLLVSQESGVRNQESGITAVDLYYPEQAFSFTREEESNSEAVCQPEGRSVFSPEKPVFLYEPNAAILKAGAYKLIAQRFGLHKLDVNTHLYASCQLVSHFPGRVWRVTVANANTNANTNANIICRNYPLTPDQLKKKLHLRDGGTAYVIGCRVAGKPTLFYAERV